MGSIPVQLPLFSPGGKVCTKCGLLKARDQFNLKVAATGRRDTRCKACMNAYCAARFAANPARQKAANDVWRAAHSEQHKATNEAYTAAHKEQSAVRSKAYHATHREQRRAAGVAWHAANKDRHNAQIAAWAVANTERAKATALVWRQANKARVYALRAAWSRENRGKVIAYRFLRRQRVAAAGRPYTGAEWEVLKAQYNYRCLQCGRSEPDITLTFDHVVPLTKGGTNDITNGQPLCGPCNSRKHTQVIDLR